MHKLTFFFTIRLLSPIHGWCQAFTDPYKTNLFFPKLPFEESSLIPFSLFFSVIHCSSFWLHTMTNIRWFYIKSATFGQVVSVDSNANENDTLRSQVYVRPPEKTDDELWCWEGRYLVNKSSRLVLDIRKGR